MKKVEIYIYFLIIINKLMFIVSQHQIPISINISIVDKIYLKLENNQILIGNRKLANFNFENGFKETRIVYEFLSLPFAEPPIGEKRFKNAFRLQRILTSDIYNATYARYACMQPRNILTASNLNYSEDCLYFNIWVPVTNDQDELLYTNQSKLYSNDLSKLKYINNSFIFGKTENVEKKSTMFWIHGGGYVYGSSNDEAYDGTVLSSIENVIVAGSNYRLGVFGFLYLNDSRVSDNIALNDQLLAIEWYKEKYVDFFGGFTNNICLFGESAGAMSIRMLMFSKKNYLFNRVILKSFFNVSYTSPQDAYHRSINYLKNGSCLEANFDIRTQKLTDSTFDCLMKIDAQSLIRTGEMLYPTSDFVNEDQTLNLDILFGFNQNENKIFLYLAFSGSYINPIEQDLENLNSDSTIYDNKFANDRIIEFFTEVPRTYLTCVNRYYSSNTSLFLNDFYNGTVDYNLNRMENLNLNSRRKAWDKISKITSDLNFNCPAIQFRKKTKTNGKIYQYKFNRRSSFNQNPRWLGVTHSDAIPFVYGQPFILSNFKMIDQLDRNLSSMIMNYFANFAKSGKL